METNKNGGKLKVAVLTAHDSLKVFRITDERLGSALKRHPHIAEAADFSITRTTTSYENTPSWNQDDRKIFKRAVADADILVGYMFPLEDFAAAAPGVRIVHIIGAGVEHILPLDWLPAGAVLTNNSGAHAPKTCEYAMMCMLMLANNMPRLALAQREARWDGHFVSLAAGSTVLVLGAGNQGQAVARGAKTLGMKVIGVDTDTSEKPCFDRIVHTNDLMDVMGCADMVAITLPLTPDTERFFGIRQIGAMKKGRGFLT